MRLHNSYERKIQKSEQNERRHIQGSPKHAFTPAFRRDHSWQSTSPDSRIFFVPPPHVLPTRQDEAPPPKTASRSPIRLSFCAPWVWMFLMVQIQFTTSAQRLESPAQSYTRRQKTAHAGGAMVAAKSTFLCRNFSTEKGQVPCEPHIKPH